MAQTKDLSDEEILAKLEGFKLVEECGGLEDLEKHEWIKFINKKTGKFCNGGFLIRNNCPEFLLIKFPGNRTRGCFKVIPDECYIYVNEERHLQVKTNLADRELQEELFRAYNDGRLIETRTKTEAKQMKKIYKMYLKGELVARDAAVVQQ